MKNLKAIVTRFSDFAKMPPPEFEAVDVNESVRSVMKLFEPQLSAVGRPPITPELYLEENIAHAQADPILLRRALENLVLNSLDAMPAGGTLTVRTSQHNGSVRLEVSDTGAGLTPEECARLFTPYYTSKRHGTGLGPRDRAIGRVSDQAAEKLKWNRPRCRRDIFVIELPVNQQGAPPERKDPLSPSPSNVRSSPPRSRE